MTQDSHVAPRLLPCGERAILVEFADGAARRAYAAALAGSDLPGVTEWVPAARTVLVRVGDPADLPRVAGALRGVDPSSAERVTAPPGPVVTVDVCYDGPDLVEVAGCLGVSPREVVARHTGQAWTVDFAGFLPGFAYLVGDVGGLEVPRRADPRTRVPAGSVGLAGPYSGIYPRASPGGWQIVGSTATPVWDARRDPPARLAPGTRVRFVEARP